MKLIHLNSFLPVKSTCHCVCNIRPPFGVYFSPAASSDVSTKIKSIRKEKEIFSITVHHAPHLLLLSVSPRRVCVSLLSIALHEMSAQWVFAHALRITCALELPSSFSLYLFSSSPSSLFSISTGFSGLLFFFFLFSFSKSETYCYTRETWQAALSCINTGVCLRCGDRFNAEKYFVKSPLSYAVFVHV